MTVKDLKKILEEFDDDLIVEVNNDCGEYDLATDAYEDEEEYCTVENFKNKSKYTWQTRKVLRIY